MWRKGEARIARVGCIERGNYSSWLKLLAEYVQLLLSSRIEKDIGIQGIFTEPEYAAYRCGDLRGLLTTSRGSRSGQRIGRRMAVWRAAAALAAAIDGLDAGDLRWHAPPHY